jgi:hypothetical protein
MPQRQESVIIGGLERPWPLLRQIRNDLQRCFLHTRCVQGKVSMLTEPDAEYRRVFLDEITNVYERLRFRQTLLESANNKVVPFCRCLKHDGMYVC